MKIQLRSRVKMMTRCSSWKIYTEVNHAMLSNRESYGEASSPDLFNLSKEKDQNPDPEDPIVSNSLSKFERVTIL
jgi:hypothetical protein